MFFKTFAAIKTSPFYFLGVTLFSYYMFFFNNPDEHKMYILGLRQKIKIGEKIILQIDYYIFPFKSFLYSRGISKNSLNNNSVWTMPRAHIGFCHITFILLSLAGNKITLKSAEPHQAGKAQVFFLWGKPWYGYIYKVFQNPKTICIFLNDNCPGI